MALLPQVQQNFHRRFVTSGSNVCLLQRRSAGVNFQKKVQCENWDYYRARGRRKPSVIDIVFHGVGDHTGHKQPRKSGRRINYSGLGA